MMRASIPVLGIYLGEWKHTATQRLTQASKEAKCVMLSLKRTRHHVHGYKDDGLPIQDY